MCRISPVFELILNTFADKDLDVRFLLHYQLKEYLRFHQVVVREDYFLLSQRKEFKSSYGKR